MPEFYDTHAHLDFPDFAEDRAEVVARARAAGISRILTIGTDDASSARAVALSEAHPEVFAAVGWHPNHVTAAPADVRPALRDLARHPKVVAIGEIGLDFHHPPSETPGATPADDQAYKARQATLFAQQLEVAAELGLNCVVHQRDAFPEAVAQMRPWAGKVRGVFHCFVNDAAALEQVLALDSLVSFTGIVTFKSAAVVRAALAAAPLDRFMLETDCPFLAPVPYRGRRCEPAYVRDLAEVVAGVKGVDLETLSAATCATARRFFPKLV